MDGWMGGWMDGWIDRTRLRSGSAHWHLVLVGEVWQCPLTSGARGWGPAVPTDIWCSRLRSGSAHWHLVLAVEVWQCPLTSGASEKEKERERKNGDLNHLSVDQWLRSAIRGSQQPTSPIGFLFLKLPPPPCAVLLVRIIRLTCPLNEARRP